MGTNFYYHKSGVRTCPHCEQETPNLHVGKSSAGWCFSLRIHPRDGINGLDDWRKLWESGGAIFDEYGEPVSIEEMVRTITERSWGGNGWTPDDLRRNHAVPGPNGLARHSYKAVPGAGTYDLCDYEFS